MSYFGKNRSIKEKLISSCIIITIIPMIILEIVFGVQTKNSEYKRRIEDAEILADNLIQNFSFEIEKAELMANNLADFIPLDTYLNTDFPGYREQNDYYDNVIHPMVAGYNNSKGSTRVRVYHNKNIKNYSLELNNGLEMFTKTYFPDDPFVKGSSFWAHVDCYPFHPALSYFRAVQDSQTKYNTLYVVSVHLREKAFRDYIGTDPENTLVILTDLNGNILTSNKHEYSRKNFGELVCDAGSMEELMNSRETEIDGNRYHVIGKKTDLLLLSVLVSSKNLKEDLITTVASFVFIGCLLFIIAAFLITYSTDRITKGISSLMDKMHNVSRSSIHHMAYDSTAEGSRDEIMQLDASFARMMRKIDELVDKVEDDERKLKDEVISRQQAELLNLQQQINPHYLFNTLESVRMNLVIKNDFENAEIIKIFAESFRRYMNVKEKDASLFEETAFIEKYIQIQNYRLGDTIKYQLTAKDTVLGCRVPKLLIQPIVENCIIHGFRKKPTGGEISLEIKKSAGELTITVSDNGAGISADQLEKIRNYIYHPSDDRSVGLQNVYKRLQIYYGGQAEFSVESAEGQGTRVKIRVPVEE